MSQYVVLLTIDGIDEVFSTEKITISGSGSSIPVFGSSNLFFGLPGLFFGLPFDSEEIETIPIIDKECINEFRLKKSIYFDGNNNIIETNESFGLSLSNYNGFYDSILENNFLLNRTAIVTFAKKIQNKLVVISENVFVISGEKNNGSHHQIFLRRLAVGAEKKIPKITGQSASDSYARVVRVGGSVLLVFSKNRYDYDRKRVVVASQHSFSGINIATPDKNTLAISLTPLSKAGDVALAINNSPASSLFEAKVGDGFADFSVAPSEGVFTFYETQDGISLYTEEEFTTLALSQREFFLIKNDNEFIKSKGTNFTKLDFQTFSQNILTFNGITRGYYSTDFSELKKGKNISAQIGVDFLDGNNFDLLLAILCSGSDNFYLEIGHHDIVAVAQYNIGPSYGPSIVTRNGFFVRAKSSPLLEKVIVGDILYSEGFSYNNFLQTKILGVEKINDDIACIIVQNTCFVESSISSLAKIKVKSQYNILNFGLGLSPKIFDYKKSRSFLYSNADTSMSCEVIFDAQKPLMQQVKEYLLEPHSLFFNFEDGFIFIDSLILQKKNNLIGYIDLLTAKANSIFSTERELSEACSSSMVLHNFSYPDDAYLKSSVFTDADALTKYSNKEFFLEKKMRFYSSIHESGLAALFLAKKIFNAFYDGLEKISITLPIDFFKYNLGHNLIFHSSKGKKLVTVSSVNYSFSNGTVDLLLTVNKKINTSIYDINECRIAPSVKVDHVNTGVFALHSSKYEKLKRIESPFGFEQEKADFFLSFKSESGPLFFQSRLLDKYHDIGNINILTQSDHLFSSAQTFICSYATQSYVPSSFDKKPYRIWAKIGKSYSIVAIDQAERKVTLNSSETLKPGRYVGFYSTSNPQLKSKYDEIVKVESVNATSHEVTLEVLPSWVTVGMKLALASVDDDLDDGYTIY